MPSSLIPRSCLLAIAFGLAAGAAVGADPQPTPRLSPAAGFPAVSGVT